MNRQDAAVTLPSKVLTCIVIAFKYWSAVAPQRVLLGCAHVPVGRETSTCDKLGVYCPPVDISGFSVQHSDMSALNLRIRVTKLACKCFHVRHLGVYASNNF